MPRIGITKPICTLGFFVATGCGHATDSTGPSVVPQRPTATASQLAFTVQPAAGFAGFPIAHPGHRTRQPWRARSRAVTVPARSLGRRVSTRVLIRTHRNKVDFDQRARTGSGQNHL